jgi:hypothetical protein
MPLRLCVLSPGKWQNKTIPIRSFPFIIGRGPDCQLRPASSLVSERHCAFIFRNGRVLVEDLGSNTGTLVDGERITEATELRHQRRLQVGPIVVQILMTDSFPDVEPQPAAILQQENQAMDDKAAAVLLDSGNEDDVAPAASGSEPPRAAAGYRKRAPAQAPSPADSDRTSAAARDLLRKYRRPGH